MLSKLERKERSIVVLPKDIRKDVRTRLEKAGGNVDADEIKASISSTNKELLFNFGNDSVWKGRNQDETRELRTQYLHMLQIMLGTAIQVAPVLKCKLNALTVDEARLDAETELNRARGNLREIEILNQEQNERNQELLMKLEEMTAQNEKMRREQAEYREEFLQWKQDREAALRAPLPPSIESTAPVPPPPPPAPLPRNLANSKMEADMNAKAIKRKIAETDRHANSAQDAIENVDENQMRANNALMKQLIEQREKLQKAVVQKKKGEEESLTSTLARAMNARRKFIAEEQESEEEEADGWDEDVITSDARVSEHAMRKTLKYLNQGRIFTSLINESGDDKRWCSVCRKKAVFEHEAAAAKTFCSSGCALLHLHLAGL